MWVEEEQEETDVMPMFFGQIACNEDASDHVTVSE